MTEFLKKINGSPRYSPLEIEKKLLELRKAQKQAAVKAEEEFLSAISESGRFTLEESQKRYGR